MARFLSCVLPASALAVLVVGCGGPAVRPSRPTPATNGPLITQEDLERYPNESIERVLQRKVPGLVVRRTRDGGLALQIRGAMSYDGSDTRPLYVLNDHPIEAGPDGAVPGINAREIQSIKVLKGPDAAIYGIRGLNGVIVITTSVGQP